MILFVCTGELSSKKTVVIRPWHNTWGGNTLSAKIKKMVETQFGEDIKVTVEPNGDEEYAGMPKLVVKANGKSVYSDSLYQFVEHKDSPKIVENVRKALIEKAGFKLAEQDAEAKKM
eukprot:jgi/Bigna1/85127/estExt_fgenesh1_pg.C_20252